MYKLSDHRYSHNSCLAGVPSCPFPEEKESFVFFGCFVSASASSSTSGSKAFLRFLSVRRCYTCLYQYMFINSYLVSCMTAWLWHVPPCIFFFSFSCFLFLRSTAVSMTECGRSTWSVVRVHRLLVPVYSALCTVHLVRRCRGLSASMFLTWNRRLPAHPVSLPILHPREMTSFPAVVTNPTTKPRDATCITMQQQENRRNANAVSLHRGPIAPHAERGQHFSDSHSCKGSFLSEGFSSKF